MELGIGGLDHATKIGAGKSAVVYRARQVDLDREVAVKILSGTDDAFVEQFNQEAKALGKLGQHPNVVTVYDTGMTGDGQPYLILELCQSSAAKRLEGGPLKPAAACVAAAQVADGLGEAHANGIAHGDIRPGNILIGQTGRYVVTDFGLGPATGAAGSDETPGPYTAPGTEAGQEPSPEADVYSLGAVLFHMASGAAPSGDAGQCREKLENKDLPKIAELVADAMNPSADDRPTAVDLRDRLLSLAAEYHNTADPTVVNGSQAGAEPALAGSTMTITDGPPIGSLAPPSPPAPSLKTGPSWLVPPAPVPASDDKPAMSVLEAEASSGINLGEQRMLPTHVEERPRRPAGLILAAFGLLIVLGGAIFLLLNQGGDQAVEDEEAVNLEAVEGPETSLDTSGNEATNGEPGGAVGSLGSGTNGDGTETTVDGFGDADPTTTETTQPPVTLPIVDVPNVVADGAIAAERQLVALGFEVTRLQEPSSTVPAGQVIRQDPAAGTRLRAGRTVTLVVAIAPPVTDVIIPAAVVGQTEAAATATLSAAGLKNLGQSTTEPSATAPAGTVIRTTPAVGTEVPDTSLITLVLSGGPVPDCATVVGLTEAAATAPFTAVGMTVTTGPVDHVSVPVGSVVGCTTTASSAALKISRGPIADLCTQASGQQITTFEGVLTAAGYTVTTAAAPSATIPAGTITGCTVTDAAVALTFASAPPPDTCPAVAGLAEADARAAALSAGFSDVTTTTRSSDTVADGVVISCSADGAVANLVVSSGPAPTEVTMPNVVGQSQADATTTLTGLNLQVDVTTTTSAEPAGTVLSTNPVAGETVPLGNTVTIEVSSGQQLVPVPDVVGRRTGRATEILEDAGFTVATQTEPAPDQSQVDRVLRTNPLVGTEVAGGTQIVMVVGT